jgi:sugar O-acyltransferase (sialic acid O-acetyltransferase NeuD family)
MKKIILIGAGGHAKSCIDIIELLGEYEIFGLVEKGIIDSEANLGYPIIGTDDDLEDLRNKYEFGFITVGQIKSAETRKRLFLLLEKLNYTLPVIISPNAYVSKYSSIGAGTIVMHGAIANSNAQIGKNCIINTKSLIEHDAKIGDNCHIATSAVINGEVNIGDESFVGSGVITKQSISIGNNCVIGAGNTVTKNINSYQIIKN